jgi:hypothetical protein
MFLGLIVITATVCGLYAAWVWAQTGDIYHPILIFTPMLAFLYVLQPAILFASGRSDEFFTEPQLETIQLVNLAGVLALLSGACKTAKARVASARPNRSYKRLRAIANLIGSIGVILWLKTIVNVGGFGAAFGNAYGGGWDDSGYIRDMALFGPMIGTLLMVYLCGATTAKPVDVAWAVILAIPMLLQGLLGARRGPTFMIIVLCICAYHMAKGRRPQLTKGVIGGAGVAFLLLFLITNRNSIYLHSEEKVQAGNISEFLQPSGGTEFSVGGAEILQLMEFGGTPWGRNWLAEVVVRPIPAAAWPTKWSDYAEWAGTRVVGAAFHTAAGETVGWQLAVGSPPGIVGEVFTEWSFLFIPILWGIGRAYANCWQKARAQVGNAPIYYTVCAALSVYVIMQGPLDTIYRFILIIGIIAAGLNFGVSSMHRAAVAKTMCTLRVRSSQV